VRNGARIGDTVSPAPLAGSSDYLQQLSIPGPWRSRVQLIPGAGHAAHQEAPATFTELLDEFLADLS
jgi:pimeloyl-ACP methyl ester carboxylesterase